MSGYLSFVQPGCRPCQTRIEWADHRVPAGSCVLRGKRDRAFAIKHAVGLKPGRLSLRCLTETPQRLPGETRRASRLPLSGCSKYGAGQRCSRRENTTDQASTRPGASSTAVAVRTWRDVCHGCTGVVKRCTGAVSGGTVQAATRRNLGSNAQNRGFWRFSWLR